MVVKKDDNNLTVDTQMQEAGSPEQYIFCLKQYCYIDIPQAKHLIFG